MSQQIPFFFALVTELGFCHLLPKGSCLLFASYTIFLKLNSYQFLSCENLLGTPWPQCCLPPGAYDLCPVSMFQETAVQVL